MGKTLLKYEIQVKTGDIIKAGTDADIFITLYDEIGTQTSKTQLNSLFKNCFEVGKTDVFIIYDQVNLQKISKIALCRNNIGIFDDWFVDDIQVRNLENSKTYIFPVFRWIKESYDYMFCESHTFLPQEDPYGDQRRMEIEDRRKLYELAVPIPGFPPQIKNLPDDEDFFLSIKLGKMARGMNNKIQTFFLKLFTKEFETLDDIKQLYKGKLLYEPKTTKTWKDDGHFGAQRLSCMNNCLIKLVTEIPEKFAITEEMILPLLEGNTLQNMIDGKRLFMTDLEILDGVPTKAPELKVCAPIALFYVNNCDRLHPIAIQLNQKPGEDNPVFLPSDPPTTWLMAKLWYNNAESYHHQGISHLVNTHLMMEGIAVISKRNFSISHPLLKLISPHFECILGFNANIMKILMPILETVSGLGYIGFKEIIKRGSEEWRLNLQGTLPEDLKSRGVLDEGVLPGYNFREDALKFYEAINNYVTKYINLYYDSDEKILNDWELQDWAQEAVKPQEDGGLGIQGLSDDGVIKSKEQLILVFNCIIYTCTAGHGVMNSPQYEEYGFPPNYPFQLHGDPPKTKDALTEKDILKALPDKDNICRLLSVTRYLSKFDPRTVISDEYRFITDSGAKQALNEFKEELKKLSTDIKEKNKGREHPYPYLNPELVPISIMI